MNKAYIEPVLNCTFKPNFDLIVTLGASEPLGGHIGGKGPPIAKIPKLMGRAY